VKSAPIDDFKPQNLADTRAHSHLYGNNVNQLLAKAVMFDILEYFLTFVV
jgi:hypothetical protein